MTNRRPHENQTTDELKQSLTAVSQQAQQYAQTGPKAWEDALHCAANDLLDELQSRS
jgi:hypothetical protein